jgi:hypothetical protein
MPGVSVWRRGLPARSFDRLQVNNILLLDDGQPSRTKEPMAQCRDRQMSGYGRPHLGVHQLALTAYRLADGQRSMKRQARSAEHPARHIDWRDQLEAARQSVGIEFVPLRRFETEDHVPSRRQHFAHARRIHLQRRGEAGDRHRCDMVLDDCAIADGLTQRRFDGSEIQPLLPTLRKRHDLLLVSYSRLRTDVDARCIVT